MLSARWVSRLPRGLQEQPAWVFIGLLVGLAGLSYLLGVSDSAVTQAVGRNGLRVWGAFLMTSGFGVVWATFYRRVALEKFTLRMLSLCMVVYVGWLLAVIDLRRAAMSVMLGLILCIIAEIRVATLKGLYRASERWERHADE